MESNEELERLFGINSKKVSDGVIAAGPYEIVGRIMRYREEAGWRNLILEAARRNAEGPAVRPVSAANLYRLLGENELAAPLWRDGIPWAQRLRSHGEVMACAYFLDDEQLLADAASAATKSHLKSWPLPELMDARRRESAEDLRTELGQWQRMAKRFPIGSNSVNPSPHDMVDHIEELLKSTS